MLKLAWIRTAVQLLSVIAFGIVTIEAKPLTVSCIARPATEGSCCASMMHGPAACPPVSGMNGTSCCNMQVCFQLFLQTAELRLELASSDFQWDIVDAHALTRSHRPLVPPPRP